MKSRKNSKRCERPYKYFTNEELLRELKDSCERYVKITKSIPIANQILNDIGLPKCKYHSDFKEKNRHDKLYKIATDRQLEIPQEWYDVNISSLDVLRRVETAYFEYLNSMSKKSKLYASDANILNDEYQQARKKVYRLKKEDLC